MSSSALASLAKLRIPSANFSDAIASSLTAHRNDFSSMEICGISFPAAGTITRFSSYVTQTTEQNWLIRWDGWAALRPSDWKIQFKKVGKFLLWIFKSMKDEKRSKLDFHHKLRDGSLWQQVKRYARTCFPNSIGFLSSWQSFVNRKSSVNRVLLYKQSEYSCITSIL